ncbi:MAG: c-type cytochrome [Alphaproteobacteria bacterium]
MRTTVAFLFATVLLFPFQDVAWGQTLPGEEIARRWCSSCHGVETSDTTTSSDAAPPFTRVSRLSREQIRAVLLAPHKQMEGIDLNNLQIEQIIDYIHGLARGGENGQ